MSRYIDADAVDFSPLKNDFDRARAKVIIMGQPTADVVSVVRCKDCKHWKKYENTAGTGYCKKREFSFEYGNEHTFKPITMPDFYCGYGERR